MTAIQNNPQPDTDIGHKNVTLRKGERLEITVGEEVVVITIAGNSHSAHLTVSANKKHRIFRHGR